MAFPTETVYGLGADATNSATKGAEEFLKTRIKDQDRLANDVSVRFFGVNISCAQCHDHPLVPSWKQDHYFGMKELLEECFWDRDLKVPRFKQFWDAGADFRALQAIADRQGLNLAGLLSNQFGLQDLATLTITEASGLMDQLKRAASGNGEGGGR